MKELQAYMAAYHKEMNWEISGENYQEEQASFLHNYMLLSTEVAEVAEELRKVFNSTNKQLNQGTPESEAFEAAKESVREDVGKELADCMAYIVKYANYFEIDLESAFYQKMVEVKERKNKDIGVQTKD
ncbi:MazG nucleotide pyrophosphohydrolase domain-containing protein [Gracilibacillus salinarum]|uniref:NTP pyrophosphohydrolase MazG putative catalytic core domain-containing protein n=1 Tax=Gracilibacillus salinarum TaxID=2932255 RepID=A0ABY4GKM0_9BACI|nr:MazG nucleotide pyrophosphohydrolase domain-containing protein [Gracilibacillus salinarum]UOQ84913.1 hypothetical protein MUN87_20045 [Gracilibacillus salinarum]